jgi:hypothetical protein
LADENAAETPYRHTGTGVVAIENDAAAGLRSTLMDIFEFDWCGGGRAASCGL